MSHNNEDPKFLALMHGLERMRNDLLDKAASLREDAPYNDSAATIQSMLTLLAKDLFNLAKAVGYRLETKAEMEARLEKTYTYSQLLRAAGIAPPDDNEPDK